MLKFLFFCIFLFPLSSSAFNLSENSLAIGYGTLIFGQHRTNNLVQNHNADPAFTPLPHIYLKYKDLELNGIEGLYRFHISKKINMGPYLKYGGDLYESFGISERRLSPFLGLYIDYQKIRLNINHGMTNPALQGFYTQLSYRDEFKINSKFKFGYVVEAEYMGADYTTYYFGVRLPEAGAFPFYESDGGSLNFSALAKAHLSLLWNVELNASAGLKTLGSGARNAPTVSSSTYFIGSAVLSYRFY